MNRRWIVLGILYVFLSTTVACFRIECSGPDKRLDEVTANDPVVPVAIPGSGNGADEVGGLAASGFCDDAEMTAEAPDLGVLAVALEGTLYSYETGSWVEHSVPFESLGYDTTEPPRVVDLIHTDWGFALLVESDFDPNGTSVVFAEDGNYCKSGMLVPIEGEYGWKLLSAEDGTLFAVLAKPGGGSELDSMPISVHRINPWGATRLKSAKGQEIHVSGYPVSAHAFSRDEVFVLANAWGMPLTVGTHVFYWAGSEWNAFDLQLDFNHYPFSTDAAWMSPESVYLSLLDFENLHGTIKWRGAGTDEETFETVGEMNLVHLDCFDATDCFGWAALADGSEKGHRFLRFDGQNIALFEPDGWPEDYLTSPYTNVSRLNALPGKRALLIGRVFDEESAELYYLDETEAHLIREFDAPDGRMPSMALREGADFD
jgi:hypothetical protein